MDLIDRQVAVDAIQQHREDVLGGYEYDEGVAFVYAAAHNHIIDVIKHLPSAQTEIILCKDCVHWVRTCGDNQWGLGDCDVFDKHLVMCEGFCAWAERRKE
jgi:hypothetical protein